MIRKMKGLSFSQKANKRRKNVETNQTPSGSTTLATRTARNNNSKAKICKTATITQTHNGHTEQLTTPLICRNNNKQNSCNSVGSQRRYCSNGSSNSTPTPTPTCNQHHNHQHQHCLAPGQLTYKMPSPLLSICQTTTTKALDVSADHQQQQQHDQLESVQNRWLAHNKEQQRQRKTTITFAPNKLTQHQHQRQQPATTSALSCFRKSLATLSLRSLSRHQLFHFPQHLQHLHLHFGIAIIVLAFILMYSCPCASALRLTNGGNTKTLSANKEQLNIGLIAPHTNFGKREYLRAINTAVQGLAKTRGAKLTFLKDYSFEPRNIHFDMMSLTPSPTGEYLVIHLSSFATRFDRTFY